VPLSDHEQRLLEQIERALYAEDPKFAATVRSTEPQQYHRRRLLRAAALIVIGIGVLVAGVITQPLIGVAGFVFMLAGTLYGIASWRRMAGYDAPTLHRRSTGPRRGVIARLEERWNRRMDDADS
jgi:hypothetical protein